MIPCRKVKARLKDSTTTSQRVYNCPCMAMCFSFKRNEKFVSTHNTPKVFKKLFPNIYLQPRGGNWQARGWKEDWRNGGDTGPRKTLRKSGSCWVPMPNGNFFEPFRCGC